MLKLEAQPRHLVFLLMVSFASVNNIGVVVTNSPGPTISCPRAGGWVVLKWTDGASRNTLVAHIRTWCPGQEAVTIGALGLSCWHPHTDKDRGDTFSQLIKV